jgi:ElaB/YqjD/DUF883 family membrane-anchored ribosome-binding protein
MKNSHDTATHTPKELLAELQTLVSEAETMIAGPLTEHTDDALSMLRERFGAAQDRFADIYAGTKKKVAAGVKVTDEAIRENPYQAVAIALGVGALTGAIVGLLIGRNSSK